MLRITVALLLALSLGCAATKEGRKIHEEGFLGDYSKLEKGPGDGAQLRYLSKSADWKSFDRMLVDPVQFQAGTLFRAAQDQPRIHRLYHLTAAAIERGHGWAFLDQVSRLICSTCMIGTSRLLRAIASLISLRQ